MDENSIFIIAEESGERIDALLARSIDGFSRSQAQKLIEAENALVNGRPVKKNYTVQTGDNVEVVIPEAAEIPLLPQDLPLDIAYEDDSVIVVNKARGMVVHPAPGHPDGTLVNALLFHCGDSLSGIGGEKRPGIVHRIDMNTSGLIIAAKTDRSHASLTGQLSDHSLYREYVAVVNGRMKNDSGTVDAPIGRHPVDRKRMAVTEINSRNAVTHWEVLERYRDYTVLKCVLETGRTHQIRAHMAYIGHPLLGDALYGAKAPDKGLTGQCLHARKLFFTHPVTSDRMEIEAPLPEYFNDVLSRLGCRI